MPKGSKQTLRATLEQVAKQTKRVPPQLAEAPECPPGLAYVWSWFHEVHTGQKLTYTELHHWSQLKGVTLDPLELKLLFMVERILIEVSKNG